ncbi:MAG: hypothetical protein AAF799_00065 [Myxococcota bacterium]
MRGPAAATKVWLLATALGAVPACGEDSDAEPAAPEAAATHATKNTDWSERLAEPTVDDIVSALAQPHAGLRTAVGPHRLHTEADFSLTPTEVFVPTEDTARPLRPVDQPVVLPQRVHDEVTLTWAPTAEGELRLSLSQHNDHDRGRDVVAIGETIHVHQDHRGWYHYTRDSDVLEAWLDDAQRSVHDAVQLAAPRLAVQATPVPEGGLEGGAAVEIALSLADQRDDRLLAGGPTQAWRTGATVNAVQGTLLLDARSGAWLRAEIDVRYALIGANGQEMDGHLQLRGDVEPGAPAAVTAPADSQPLPTRVRYDEERRQLLDGLAAP